MIAGNNCIVIDLDMLGEIHEEEYEDAALSDSEINYSYQMEENIHESVDYMTNEETTEMTPSSTPRTLSISISERITANRTAAELEYRRKILNKINLSYLRWRGLIHLCTILYIFVMTAFVYPLCSKKPKPTVCGKAVIGSTISMLVMISIAQIVLRRLERTEVRSIGGDNRPNND
ncbi:hypothetical protein [Candidatus Ichthyocystis hellenicum]|uniref:hypothetical protein n=1 Tax=Candidatus Ichthyocystis hellenicum TaxID=1561003 RepID=UPI000B89A53D|nr:hypothetical protein [Candidatus Ichthyocystis hellenicum]